MTPKAKRAYEIRIRTPTGGEAHVRGAVFLNGDADVTLVDQLTPIDVKGHASLVSGIVQAAEPTGRVYVEMLAADEDGSMRKLMTASGRTVLLGDEEPRDRSRFIRAM